MSSLRHVQVGGRWEPPPPATGLDPDACASAHEWREVLQQLAAAAPPDRAPTLQQLMVRGFRGVSPQLARDIALAAGVPPDALPADLAAEQWAALHEQWQVWLQRLASGSFAPSCCPTTGAYSLLGAQPQAVPALLPFLSAYYTAEQRAEQFGGVKQQVARAVAAAIARLDKKIESLQRQGGEGDKHQQIQKAADMIMASLHRWGSGAGRGGRGCLPTVKGTAVLRWHAPARGAPVVDSDLPFAAAGYLWARRRLRWRIGTRTPSWPCASTPTRQRWRTQRRCTSRWARRAGAGQGRARRAAWQWAAPQPPPTACPMLPCLQARKQRRAVEQVAPLLAAARSELEWLAEVEVMVAQLEGGAHLTALMEVQVRR